MKILIIEDEARAASHLERLLKKVEPRMEVLARVETVRDAVEFLSHNHSAELIFSDVQLADGLCFEIYKQVEVTCPIIFTTAYDHYAMEAFKTNGIDYLLKPIDEESLEKAIEKAKRFSPAQTLEKLLSLTGIKPPKHFKSRFMVRVGDKIKTIPVEEITTFYSLEKATWLHTRNNRNYNIDFTLDQLEDMLDPTGFFRINRRYIVSPDACNNITAWSNSRLKMHIEGIDDNDIIVARERVQEFREWLDQ